MVLRVFVRQSFEEKIEYYSDERSQEIGKLPFYVVAIIKCRHVPKTLQTKRTLLRIFK